MRAWIYFSYLRKFGDYPIITEVLPDDKAVLMEKSVRQPRNLVARFILEDLDKAISMLKGWGFASNNRINKETALLVSHVSLFTKQRLKNTIKVQAVYRVMQIGRERKCILISLWM